MKENKKVTVLVHIVVLLFLVGTIFPFYWMVISSFKEFMEILRIPPTFFPTKWDISSYIRIFSDFNIDVYFKNSILLALLTSIITTFVSSLAAYSITFFKYKGRIAFSRLILFVYMFPPVLVVIPLYVMMSKIGLINTRMSVLLACIAFNVPVTVHILKAYFSTLPKGLIDASEIDGLSRVGALFRIVLPIAAPGIATAAIFAFIGSWNEFLFSNTFLMEDLIRTFPVAIVDLNSQEAVRWGAILSASTLFAIPSFLFALLAQKYLVSGLSAGSVKG